MCLLCLAVRINTIELWIKIAECHLWVSGVVDINSNMNKNMNW